MSFSPSSSKPKTSGASSVRLGLAEPRKTTYLSRQIVNAARNRGSDHILVASFTRGAASEIAGRNLPLPKGQIGTLHALCYRMLDRPVIAETRIDDWNEKHPNMAVSGGQSTVDPDEPTWDEGGGAKHGDKMMQEYERLRAQRADEWMWPTSVRAFAAKWEDWKKENDLLDFSDLIETVYEQGLGPPGQATVGFIDEVQDLTPLEMALVRMWGRRLDMLLLAGDDDQTIYSFKGATPDAFLDPPLPDDRIRVLGQSYRVPRVIHDIAGRWIAQVSHRQPKEHQPRDADGDAWRLTSATWRSPESVVDLAKKRMADDKTVMILAACSYMLDPVRKLLRADGVPYGNRYRRRRGDWNPLATRRGAVSAAERVLAFLRPDPAVWGEHSRMWNADDLHKWMGAVKAKGALSHGAKKRVAEWSEAGGVTPLEYDDVSPLFADWEQFVAALDGDLEWLRSVLMPRSAKTMGYAIDVAQAFGAAALLAEPPVTLGTIHCQPPDSPVLTVDGYKPIGELDPDTDRLVGFQIGSNRMMASSSDAKTRGKAFVKASRDFSGDLVRIKTAASEAVVTPTHRVRACYDESFYNRWVVYLMRRGAWWRIGICTSAHMPYRSGGVMGRLATEQADAGWLLGVYDTRKEAIVAEAYFQGQWGVPSATFEAAKGRAVSSADLQDVHDATSHEVAARVRRLFADTGMDPEQPLYTRTPGGKAQNMAGYWFTTAAANLIDGRFRVPVVPEQFVSGYRPQAERARISREPYIGEVVSVELEGGHYVTGGQLTHNSVKGGEANTVVLFPDVSRAGMSEWLRGGESSDGVVRQFYVGMTRASEELVVPHPASRLNVDIGGAM